MKIAVNTRLLRKNAMDGIGWFKYNTLQYIVKNNPGIEFHFFFDSAIDKEFLFGNNVVPHKLLPPAKHPALNIIWSEFSVRKKLKQLRPHLYFSPDGMLCLGWNGPQYGVIHDINFMHHPEFLTFSNRTYYRRYFPRFAQKATRIGTVSTYSKDDIARTFQIDPEKIDVVYCGVNSFFQPVDVTVVSAARERYTSGRDFFLFVGTLSPRKNILGLMQAYELFRETAGQDIKLVIAGGGMYKTRELSDFRKKSKYGHDIIFTGRLENEELNNLYASAIALVFVPFFEGFGIPLVEAMQSRLPIIASNSTSIPEITGDAAILVDPGNISQIAEAMQSVADDKKLRHDLIRKGLHRRHFFSWKKTADLLWKGMCQSL